MRNLFPSMLFAAIAGTASATSPAYKTVEPAEFEKIIGQSDIYLIDVRNADEYKESHIKNARNIDVMESDFLDKAQKELPSGSKVAVYCRSGKRSAQASEILSKHGYKVINLDGGITNWIDKKLPVTK